MNVPLKPFPRVVLGHIHLLKRNQNSCEGLYLEKTEEEVLCRKDGPNYTAAHSNNNKAFHHGECCDSLS